MALGSADYDLYRGEQKYHKFNYMMIHVHNE